MWSVKTQWRSAGSRRGRRRSPARAGRPAGSAGRSPAHDGEHGEREGDVGGDRHRPAAAAPSRAERRRARKHEGRHDHAADRADDGQHRLAGIAQFADHQLALELQARPPRRRRVSRPSFAHVRHGEVEVQRLRADDGGAEPVVRSRPAVCWRRSARGRSRRAGSARRSARCAGSRDHRSTRGGRPTRRARRSVGCRRGTGTSRFGGMVVERADRDFPAAPRDRHITDDRRRRVRATVQSDATPHRCQRHPGRVRCRLRHGRSAT